MTPYLPNWALRLLGIEVEASEITDLKHVRSTAVKKAAEVNARILTSSNLSLNKSKKNWIRPFEKRASLSRRLKSSLDGFSS